jgi:alpha-tubulin suppressor-like RCC1 family protein
MARRSSALAVAMLTLLALTAPTDAIGATRVDRGSAVNPRPIEASVSAPALDASIDSTAGNGVAAGASSSFRGRLDVGLIETTCLVGSDGRVRCWGGAASRMRGDGADYNRVTPAPVLGLYDAVQAATGASHGCALRATGAVTCWGDNNLGQLGNGTAGTGSSIPIPSAVTGAVQIGVGLDFSCALLGNGTVKCWGSNSFGALGNGGPIGPGVYSGSPFPVVGITAAIQLSVGGDFACALLSDGTARCWGNDIAYELGHAAPNGATATSTPVAVTGLSNARQLSAGFSHACALLANGTVKCWGNNVVGEVGNGAKLPGGVVSSPQPVANLSGVSAVDAGVEYTCALLTTGAMACWGRDSAGELGDGGTTNTSSPVNVINVPAAVDVSAGDATTCALIADGRVYCWGLNESGELGRRTANDHPNPPGGPVIGDLHTGQISAGSGFTCALTAAALVRCWGRGDLGQLGDGVYHSGPQSTPVAVKNLSGVVAISAGTNYACAITSSGRGYCWGDDTYGQLGNNHYGAGVRSNVPVAVVNASSVAVSDLVGISAGGSTTCGLRRTLKLVCWGRADDAQLGDGTTIGSAPRPYAGSDVSGSNTYVSVSVGSRHVCAVASSSGVWCWGDNSNKQLGVGGNLFWSATPVAASAAAIEVAARYQYTCGLEDDGTVKCWGWTGYDVLGAPSASDTFTPVTVTGIASAVGIGPSSNHGVHTCAVLADGTAKCWGANDQGQLGKGSTSVSEQTPVAVSGLSGAVQISVGFQHSCALLSSGGAKCWGNNDYWELGSTSTSPDPSATAVDSFSVGPRAVAIEAGSSHTCAVTADAAAMCWGSNGSGRLGNGSTTNSPIPVRVADLSNVTAVSAGGAHSCALVATGVMTCWGYNAYGQLADGTTVSRTTPLDLVFLLGITAISAGGNHTCALVSNGTVKCWGLNSSGQLGDGTTTNRKSPVTVKTSSTTTLSGVIAISAGTSHTCALLSNGTARCWGAGGSGRLGNGSTSNHAYAVAVSGVTTSTSVSARFTSISAGGAHTCARIANGTAKCWGAGGSGRLGNASTSSHSTPVTVSSLSSVVQISAGGSHSCALISNGTAKCWGYDAYGQLGINSTSSKTTPVTVSGLAGAVSISAGGNHTAAMLGTGGLRAWGLNSSGQVGDGTTTNRLTPRSVSGF